MLIKKVDVENYFAARRAGTAWPVRQPDAAGRLNAVPAGAKAALIVGDSIHSNPPALAGNPQE